MQKGCEMTPEEAIYILNNTAWLGTDKGIEVYPAVKKAVEALEEVERHNETFEWCTDCKEYDKDNHCCHRWTKRIRDTVEEMKCRFSWHDLRKNPDDLPRGGEYLCLAQSRNPYCEAYYEDKKEIIEYVYDVIEFHRGKFLKGESKYYISDIIAWREIEPFDEEE